MKLVKRSHFAVNTETMGITLSMFAVKRQNHFTQPNVKNFSITCKEIEMLTGIDMPQVSGEIFFLRKGYH